MLYILAPSFNEYSYTTSLCLYGLGWTLNVLFMFYLICFWYTWLLVYVMLVVKSLTLYVCYFFIRIFSTILYWFCWILHHIFWSSMLKLLYEEHQIQLPISIVNYFKVLVHLASSHTILLLSTWSLKSWWIISPIWFPGINLFHHVRN